MRSGKLYTRENVLLTSSPSLRKRGALTKARLNVLSWLGLLTLTRTRVSPESTLLTFACEMAILEFGIDIIETVQVQKWGQTHNIGDGECQYFVLSYVHLGALGFMNMAKVRSRLVVFCTLLACWGCGPSFLRFTDPRNSSPHSPSWSLICASVFHHPSLILFDMMELRSQDIHGSSS